MDLLKARQVSSDLRKLADKEIARNLSWYFKTGKGEYGEGDKFLGIKVPQLRSIARNYADLSLTEIANLSKSIYHEERFTAVVILVNQYKKLKDNQAKKTYFDFYLKLVASGSLNNWDLIDVSAPYLGEYLLEFPDRRELLQKLARSRNLWNQRSSIMLTWPFIRSGKFEFTFEIVEELLNHRHDLIHKAAGWMLREIGKRDPIALRGFLKRHASTMPRVMLRYAIERMPERERKTWLLVRN